MKRFKLIFILVILFSKIQGQEFIEYKFLNNSKVYIPTNWKVASDYTKESLRQYFNLETGKEYTKGKVQLLVAAGKKKDGIMTIQFSYRILDGSLSKIDLKSMKNDLIEVMNKECELLKKELPGLANIKNISDCITKYEELGGGIGASLKYLKKEANGYTQIVETFFLFKKNIKYTLTIGIPFEEMMLWESTRNYILQSLKL